MANIQGKTIRGNMMHFICESIKQKHGLDAFDKVLKQMKDEDSRKFFSGSILSNQWYDLKYHIDLLSATEKVLGKEELRSILHENAEKQLTGLYGLVVKFVSLDRLLGKSKEMWLKQFNPGTLTVIKNTEDEIVFRLAGYETYDLHAWAATVWFERFLELVNKRRVVKYSYTFTSTDVIEFAFKFGDKIS